MVYRYLYLINIYLIRYILYISVYKIYTVYILYIYVCVCMYNTYTSRYHTLKPRTTYPVTLPSLLKRRRMQRSWIPWQCGRLGSVGRPSTNGGPRTSSCATSATQWFRKPKKCNNSCGAAAEASATMPMNARAHPGTTATTRKFRPVRLRERPVSATAATFWQEEWACVVPTSRTPRAIRRHWTPIRAILRSPGTIYKLSKIFRKNMKRTIYK